ncbi:GNAT family N-acetyltransferase [Ovoidimarina sediminis]|uniref:GNAT family N-acetyltransferase n=1 Tax=Ovoidimarina sediminis TaxID=3079856 RepID=UPI0029096488|nr:GNAT family protein [Rhodophyticola sp. MJ-SS7]MDU8943008.1 GNAT family protein [Rhodophyticola sp. MJ-SS7]
MHDPNAAVPGWTPPPRPTRTVLEGRHVTLEPLSRAHLSQLHEANRQDDRIWVYLPYGPFTTEAEYGAWLDWAAASEDPLFFAIRPRSIGQAQGVASYLRIAPEAGSIEVGHINFAAPLQRTIAATEAMYLMMRWAFGAGYRRYEWKCNASNFGSRRAAERLGFSFEGVFRQAAVIKGRNRDTAWFAAIDGEWPALEAAFEAWLSPENFDADGHQRQSLSQLTAPILAARDPTL